MSQEVLYFSGCVANYADVDIGRAAVHVLERNRMVVRYPEQRCCGMPQLGQGNLAAVLARVRFNVRSLSRGNTDIVTSCTSCALMLKHYYPLLLSTDEVQAISTRTYELIEYLVMLRDRGNLDTDFRAVSGRFLYHAPCHLKALGTALIQRRLKLLAQIPQAWVAQVDRGCCGLAGSFGLSRRNRRLSVQIGLDLFKSFRQMPGCKALTECPGCRLQIRRGAGVAVLHPIELLQQAYWA